MGADISETNYVSEILSKSVSQCGKTLLIAVLQHVNCGGGSEHPGKGTYPLTAQTVPANTVTSVASAVRSFLRSVEGFCKRPMCRKWPALSFPFT